MQNNLNVLVSDLGPTQLGYYLIRNINTFHGKNPNSNIQVFTENLSKFCIRPLFGVMSVSEAWGQTGPFLATNLATAAKLLHFPLASKKLFYIWDLEFLRNDNRVYDYYSPFYLDNSLELVCRSKEHKDIVENAFNRDVKHIVHNFNMDQLNAITRN